ncbi:SAF domain-containing protein [Nocardioides ferulae]|uniref:SAF domain-containing protein n=1 Tax=Nocardioides ferulae TaxID=2340821 RepID=UPI001F0CA0F0|nr:SAF domain-containing protein [Nocardioides ferulae]
MALARRRLIAAVLAGVATAAGLQAASAPPPATVPVTVAAHDLPAGVVLGPDDLTTARFPAGSGPARGDLDPVGRVLAAPVARGEPVTDVRLVGAALTEGHPGLTALPVRLPDAGVAALLHPGDRVDLVASDPQGSGGASVVASAVPVLAVPDAEPGSAMDGLSGRLVLVGLSPEEVPAVAEAAVRLFLTVAFPG